MIKFRENSRCWNKCERLDRSCDGALNAAKSMLAVVSESHWKYSHRWIPERPDMSGIYYLETMTLYYICMHVHL